MAGAAEAQGWRKVRPGVYVSGPFKVRRGEPADTGWQLTDNRGPGKAATHSFETFSAARTWAARETRTNP